MVEGERRGSRGELRVRRCCGERLRRKSQMRRVPGRIVVRSGQGVILVQKLALPHGDATFPGSGYGGVNEKSDVEKPSVFGAATVRQDI
jgi:hypothetical protein